MNQTPLRCLISAIACSSSLFLAASTAPAHESAEEMAQAANAFLGVLDEAEKVKAVFAWDSAERQNWHFIPKERNGLTLKEMSDDQRHLAYALLSSGMSHAGYQKALTIMSLEQVLHELENNSPTRDTVKYYFSIFGTPGNDNTWGWRVEGHHLSLNFTIIKGKKISATPTFFGANPGILKGDHPRAGLRTLGREEDLGRELLTSLDADQMKKVMLEGAAPEDVVTPIVAKVEPLAAAGIRYTDLNDDQKAQLEKLIDIYVSRNRPELAEADWKKIRDAGINNVRFAWSGSAEKGAPHYYRAQGPTFIMEWVNVQNGANHPHSVWRDFDNDFGADLLRQHLAEEH